MGFVVREKLNVFYVTVSVTDETPGDGARQVA